MPQISADRNPLHLWPGFRSKVDSIIDKMNRWCEKHYPGHTCIIVEGFRTAGYQNRLYQQGRTAKGSIVTQRDGFTNESVHQSSLAVDLAPQNAQGQIAWTPPQAFWDYLGHCAREEGLDYGGDWKGFKDIDHVQWSETDRATFQAARTWQHAEGLR